MTILFNDDYNLILRIARKEWRCKGHRESARGCYPPVPGCSVTIRVGEQHVEYTGEAPMYVSNPDRFCMACAKAVWAKETVAGWQR